LPGSILFEEWTFKVAIHTWILLGATLFAMATYDIILGAFMNYAHNQSGHLLQKMKSLMPIRLTFSG
ncbi:MAG: hypothetical protein ACI4OB_04635, partial [Christensenellales bacterium]